MSSTTRVLGVLALCLGLAACGSVDAEKTDAAVGDGPAGDGPVVVDAPMVDAPPGGNALGQVCTFADATCPAGHTCTGLQGVGSQTMGYCSPMCMNMSEICATGYTGPAGGMPVCAITAASGEPPSLCAIICTTASQCPQGLACIPVPNQNPPVSVCAPPA